MKLRNILALCCAVILSLISCSKDKEEPAKDTLSGSEWTASRNSNPNDRENATLKFTSEKEGVILIVSEEERRINFTYELKGSSITLNATEFNKKENKTLVKTIKGTLDRAKGILDLRYTEDGEESSAIFHRK
ncbi:MAG: hypothetical protein ACTTIW_06335 [Porphyromonas sp.]